MSTPTVTETSFAGIVEREFDRYGISEPVVWRLRGIGYADLAWRHVNRTIRDAILARGEELVVSWFETYPKPRSEPS